MAYDRSCDEIVAQTGELASFLHRRDEPTDARAPVASCPGWNVGQLLRHLGGVQRWAAQVVGSRAERPVPDEYHGPLTDYGDEDLQVVVPWLLDSAAQPAAPWRRAGPAAAAWTRVRTEPPVFSARRFAHEALVHRADVSLALDGTFTAEPEVAIDALDEWMELGSLPLHLDRDPRVR